MDQFLYYLYIGFGYLMKGCFHIATNYGVAIILFTLATKIVMMPISIWIQKNSITMVRIQPQINMLKANYNGNLDAIAEGQQKLFKDEHYHPLITLIPLILQIVLLLAVIYIIYHPLGYLFGMSFDEINAMGSYLNIDMSDSSGQLMIVDAIKQGKLVANEATASALNMSLADLTSTIEKLNGFQTNFLGINLLTIPANVWGWYTFMPVAAALSSWIMCVTQNISNVLQKEQGKINQYGIMILSVGLSLYLGIGVPSGIAIYWIASNLLSIAIMYILNFFINPKKYVDYEALEASRIALDKAKNYGKIDKKDPLYKVCKAKEKEDIKRFKHVANKHIVFYSERNGFYKYFKDIIENLLKKSNLTIHYVTNDYNDKIFEIAENEPRIRTYYVSLKKTVMLMMMMEADMVVMTTPDLDKMYLKRSYIKKDIEYVYVPHDMMSVHMSFNEGAFDAFDTILCSGQHVVDEMKEIINVYNLPEKNLVEFGYPLADLLEEQGNKANLERDKNKEIKDVLIAPSWQEDNLMDSVLDDLISNLYGKNYHIIVRPHPEYVKRYGFQLEQILNKYKDYDKTMLTFETDFTVNRSIYSSDIIITDWSGVGPEFAFATKRPVIFVNTKVKCNNPNYEKISLEPVEISLRNQLGVSLNKDEMSKVDDTIKDLLSKEDEYKEKITNIYNDFIFNHGKAGEAGARYILKSLASKKQK